MSSVEEVLINKKLYFYLKELIMKQKIKQVTETSQKKWTQYGVGMCDYLSLMYYIEVGETEKVILTNQLSKQCNRKYIPFNENSSRVWWGN